MQVVLTLSYGNVDSEAWLTTHMRKKSTVVTVTLWWRYSDGLPGRSVTTIEQYMRI